MSFGTRLLQARKAKGLSQDDLAKFLGTKGPAIERYESDEMKPFFEAASKIAQTLDVSLDWLMSHTDLELDKKMIQRIQEVSKMKPKNKEYVFAMLDAFLSNHKLKAILK